MSNSNALRRLWRLCLGFKGSLNRLNRYGHSWLSEKIESLLQKRDGKKVVPQLLPLIIKNSIVITLLPLDALGAEQLEDIEKLPLAKPVWLHAGNNNPSTLQRIRAGIYTHILLSPEIACSIKFYDQVLSSSWFRKRLKAVVVDEAHLVVDWGRSFRKAYSLLKHFRKHRDPGSGFL